MYLYIWDDGSMKKERGPITKDDMRDAYAGELTIIRWANGFECAEIQSEGHSDLYVEWAPIV
jgi:hypothetical protein